MTGSFAAFGVTQSISSRSVAHVLSDVGVSASLAVAALESAAINVEVNLRALKDQGVRAELHAELDGYLGVGQLGREIVTNVRQGIAS